MRKTTKKRKVTAVLFDWDLTLAHVIGVNTYSERLQAIFRRGGLEFTLAEIEASMRSQQVDTALLKLPLLPGVPQTQKEITNYYRDILWRLGFISDDNSIFDYLYNVFAELPLTLYDDTLDTLDQLHQRGVALGIVTNHSSLIRPVIDRLIGRYIPTKHVIISQDINLYKPSLAIFRYAATQLRTLSADCLFIGDNLFVDAVGAVEQGGYAQGLWLDRDRHDRERSLPDGVQRITTLSQALDFI